MTRSLRTLTDDEIRALVNDNFGVDVRMEEFLAGVSAINARVVATDGTSYVFKAEYPSRTMTNEYADWLSGAHEAAYAAGIPVARQVPAKHPFQASSGESSGFVAVAHVDGEPVIVRLQTFLPGQEASEADLPDDYPAQFGRLAGRVARALATVPPAPDMILHPWAFESTGQNVLYASESLQTWEASGQVPGDIGPSLTRVLAFSRRAAHDFETTVKPILNDFPHQVLHQDINDQNVLVSGGKVTGLLDFGDCRVTARMAEVAIASSYVLTLGRETDRERPREIIAQVAQAYQATTEGTDQHLSQEELDALEAAAIARLCLGACTWAARVLTTRPGEPAHVYGQKRLNRTWPVISQLAHTPLFNEKGLE